MAIKSINLVWVSVHDFPAAIQFYRDILGLKVHEINENYGWAEFSGQEGGALLGVAMTRIEALIQSGQNGIVTFTVDNIMKTKADLIQKGVRMVGEIEEVPDLVKMQLFVDVSGNHAQLVELLQKED